MGVHQAEPTKASTRIMLVHIMYNIFRLLMGVHEAEPTKASTRIMLVHIMYNIFRLLMGVPDYSSSEVIEKNKN